MRWTSTADNVYAVTDAAGEVELPASPPGLELDSAALVGGGPVPARETAAGVFVVLPSASVSGPQVVRFRPT